MKKKYWTARQFRTMVLFVMPNLLLLPVVAWGAVEEDFTFPSPSDINTEAGYNFDWLASSVRIAEYESSSALSLSLADEPTSSVVSNSPDWDGIKSDTAHFLGYQLAIIGALWVAPTSISGWTDETKEDFSIQQYKDNVRKVVWDKDDWWINYILHPYWGGAYYVRAQQRGFGPVGSFWYAATLSTIYEFGAEAFFEEPSIQDMIVTPGAGYFVGKYFMDVRAEINQKPAGQLSASDKFILVMTDPIGAANRTVDGWFGKEADASVQLMLGPQFRPAIANENSFGEGRQMTYIGSSDFGVKMKLRW